ncbi:hypothetical protein AAFF27_05675 [Xylophilus sp. GW821-FHT01B05]
MGNPYRQITLAITVTLAAMAGTHAFAQAPRLDVRDMSDEQKQQYGVQGAPAGTSVRVQSERGGDRARREANRRAQWERDREDTRSRARAWADDPRYRR